MIKQIAWNTFKNTGNINTLMELIEVENISAEILRSTSKLVTDVEHKEEVRVMEKKWKVNQYGDIENKGNNNSRK